MTPTEPQVSDSGRYTITETSKILKLHPNTVRAHTEAGLIKCGFRRCNGRKFYTGSEIKRYWRSTY
jgi:DNA-binding transcriptional MerR regulator